MLVSMRKSNKILRGMEGLLILIYVWDVRFTEEHDPEVPNLAPWPHEPHYYHDTRVPSYPMLWVSAQTKNAAQLLSQMCLS